jgi:ankyrin repeat protein
VPAVAALAVGMRVRERIDAQTYRAWLRKALWVMALLLIAQFTHSALASEPLFVAIAEHREAAALELVARKQADFGARDANGDTPLHRAVETGMRKLTQSLLSAGADPRARTRNGETALHLAALHPEPDYTDLLLAKGADPRLQNADGESPLHWAALSGHIVVVQRLLARGADPKAKTREGQTARDFARREGHPEIAKLLERADQ